MAKNTFDKEKLNSIRKNKNLYSQILNVLSLISIVVSIVFGSVYSDNAGGFITFFICLLIGLFIALMLSSIGQVITILHDIRRKLYKDEIK